MARCLRAGAAVLVAVTLAVAAPAVAHHGHGCKTKKCHQRVAHRAAIAKKRAVVAPYRARFMRIAWCESRHRWSIVAPPHYGGLQFTLSSWAAVGGRGMPNRATRLEQLYRGVLLMRLQGWGAWPICGRLA